MQGMGIAFLSLPTAARVIFKREMGVTLAEFLRTLPYASGDQPYTVDHDTIILKINGRQVRSVLHGSARGRWHQ
jgi:hypothetical protein